MVAGPSEATKIFLQKVSIVDPPKSAIDWLIEIGLAEKWSTNAAESREAAEKWEQRFLLLLRRELSECNISGRFAPFDFNSSSDYMLQGCSFIEPKDIPAVQEAKRNRAQYNAYVDALTALTAGKFESLCSGLLNTIGVDNPITTKYSADEGIDFYGKLKLEKFVFSDHHFPGIQQQLECWLIGQAKHYIQSDVSTSEIRELVGSVELAKGKAFSSLGEKYSDLQVRVCDPIFFLFFTTGRLTSASWRLLRLSGVIGMDGQMIAALLADKQIGVSGGVFDQSTFDGWVSKFAH